MQKVTTFLHFYKNKRILVTGHTGFKGSWLCKALSMFGADVIGYALAPNTEPSLFELGKIESIMKKNIINDIRNKDQLEKTIIQNEPEIIFHMAAQPLVLESYKSPVYTYETNFIGTLNLLEAARKSSNTKVIVNITTDKVYRNNEWDKGYSEDDYLDGYEPYSNSKSCSELVTACYKRSFLEQMGIAVSTARSGNVIGGGDFSKDRIIPDCIRSVLNNEPIPVRNPYSIRPFQHVLETVYAYMLIAYYTYFDISLADSYNIACNESDCITTGDLVNLFCKAYGENASWVTKTKETSHEAKFLKLNCDKIKQKLNWQPRWNINKAIEKTVEFVKSTDKVSTMEQQIRECFCD